MSYISISKYLERYDHESTKILGEGSYGKVYDSNGYAIKYQDWTDSSAFFGELSILTQYKHPNIISLEDFTINKEEGILIFPMGKMLEECFKNGEISISNIIKDLVNLLLFLEEKEICHGDIKLENCLVISGQVKIIDWGLVHFSNNKYFTGVSYTPTYRDPEYREDIPMPLKVELFTIPMIIYELLDFEFFQYKDTHVPFYPEISIEDLPDDCKIYHDFLTKCTVKLSNRQSISELSKLIPDLEITTGSFVSNKLELKKALKKQYMNKKNLKDIVKYMMKMALNFNFNSKTLLLSVKNFIIYLQRFKYLETNKFEITAEASLFVAHCLTESATWDLIEWEKESKHYYNELLYNIKNHIILLNGKLYDYMDSDYAQNQLEHVIFNMISNEKVKIPDSDDSVKGLIPLEFEFQGNYTLRKIEIEDCQDKSYEMIIAKAISGDLPSNLNDIFKKDKYTKFNISKRLNLEIPMKFI